MAITLVQSIPSGTAGVTNPTQALAFTSNNTAGNLLIVKAASNNPITLGSIADSQTNTYVLAGGIYSNAQIAGWYMGIYYCLSAKAGANTVTLTSSSTNGFFTIEEYNAGSGLTWSGLDGTQPQNNGNSATATAGPIVTTNANDVLLGLMITLTAPTTVGSGFTTNGAIGISGSQFGMSEYQIVTTTGSRNVTAAPGASASWMIIGAAVMAAAPAGGGGGVGGSLIGAYDFWGGGFS